MRSSKFENRNKRDAVETVLAISESVGVLSGYLYVSASSVTPTKTSRALGRSVMGAFTGSYHRLTL